MSDEAPFQPVTDEPTSLFAGKSTKQTRTPRTPGSKPQGRPNKHNQRKEKLLVLLGTTGSAVMFFEAFDGQVILQHAEEVAEATATLADEVPAVAKALDAMSTGGAYGAFFIALASMILPILAHHNVIPAFIADGLVPKDIADNPAA